MSPAQLTCSSPTKQKLILVCVQDVPTGPVVFAEQKEPHTEVEVEQEEHELAAVRQPIQEVIIVDQTNAVL